MIIPFWTEDPSILLNNKYITEIWCENSMQSSQKLNAISRLVILLTTVGWIIMQNNNFLFMGILTLGILVGVHYYNFVNKSKLSMNNIGKEGFTNPDLYNELKGGFEAPTPSNPLMNVEVSQFGTKERETPAAPSFNPAVEVDINTSVKKQILEKNPDIDNLEDRLFKDLGDNFVFNQSMRNFYAMPSTTVPNNQAAFAEFCYGNMPSCKENNSLACTKHTARHPMI